MVTRITKTKMEKGIHKLAKKMAKLCEITVTQAYDVILGQKLKYKKPGVDKIAISSDLLDGDFPFDIMSKSPSQIAELNASVSSERTPSKPWPPPPKRKRFKRYAHERLEQGRIAYTYKIVELGVKDSDPFPMLRIAIDPKLIADALNEAHFQGYKGMAETLHEITKGVLHG